MEEVVYGRGGESVRRSVLSDFFLTSWTVLCQAPLSLKPSKARMLEWGATPFSRGSSQPRDRTPSLPYCGQILLHLSHQRSPTADMRPLL